VIRFAAGAVADFGTWSNGDMFPQQKTISGVNTGAYVTFKTNQYASDLYASASNPNGEFSAVIESSIGISFVSIDQARLNLANEQPSHAFDDVQSKATQTWLDLLTTVAPVVQGANNESSLFYTHLYQSFTAPTKWSESDGAYLGFDKQIHYLNESKQLVTGVYTDMSIWDIARTEYPLLAWLQPQRAADIVNSMLLLVEQSGSRTTLPKWMFLNGDTNGMVALHSILMLGDAHFGPTPFKLDAVGLDIAATSLRDRQGGDAYVKRGYADTQSPCDTIEYSMDDWCLARMAGSLGNTSVQQSFEQTSKFWRNVFHPQKKFMCARDSNGHWTDCDLPDSIWNILALNWATKEYVEGNAWHYRFFAPHDMDALVAAYGDDVFTAALEQLFVGAENGTRSNLLPDPYYWAGNEPSLFSIFGFAHQANAGPAAEAMQRHARFLLREKYTLTPDGLPGNNDYGTMSAWWLWGALGMWPLPCGNRFYFGSPALQHVVLNTPGADGVVRTLEMTATNWTADRTKVQRIRVDGVTVFDAAQPTPGALIYQADSLLSGSHHFEFNMAI
jgi:predicted alpha-1,2-mannosidase